MTVELQEERKARGAFYTPPELCDFITEWALRTPGDSVLEPSCGEAAFLLSAADRLRQIGALKSAVDLHGVEIHAGAAGEARALLASAGVSAQISVADFFEYRPDQLFDAAVGNPPYVRYQHFDGESRNQARMSAQKVGVDLSAMASSWAGFVVHASQLITRDGRLGLVLPAELLSANYAAEIRRFLLARFSDIKLILFRQLVFPDVTEEIILLLAEGSGPANTVRMAEVHDTAHLHSLGPSAWIPLPKDPNANWLSALLDEGDTDILGGLDDSGVFERLESWGSPRLGMVTGANSYFTLSEDDRRNADLPNEAMLRISPPGSRHLRGTAFSPSGWRSLRSSGSHVYLFRPNLEQAELPEVRAYIARGEAQGVVDAFKCRVREPWWRVPLVDTPDLFLTYMNHDAPRLVSNTASVRYLNSVHGLKLSPGRRRAGLSLLPTAFLNSATLLSAELVGRSYGGGILKLEPGEGRRVLVPSLGLVKDQSQRLFAIRPRVRRLLSEGNFARAVALVDQVILDDGARLAEPEIKSLRAAREAMFGRRQCRT